MAYYIECNCSTAPPRFTSKPPPLIFIKEGGNLTLSISVFGNPQPKITWSVRLKIHENESRVNSTGDEKFELNYIRFEDEGVITCRAENVFGVQETEVELTVLGKFLFIFISSSFAGTAVASGGEGGAAIPAPLGLLSQTHQVCGWICFL